VRGAGSRRAGAFGGALALALVLAPPSAALASRSERDAESAYHDASMDLDGELLSAHFTDVVGDARAELCVAVRTAERGKRELRFHALDRRGLLERVPFRVVPVFPDVVAYGLADVRAEPGRELLLFTRSGLWSCSLESERLRGNVRRLIEAELLFDVPDPFALPRWEYVVDADPLDWIVVPAAASFEVWGPSEDGAYRSLFTSPFGIDAEPVQLERPTGTVSLGPGTISVQLDTGSELFIEDSGDASFTLLDVGREYLAPALADVDGDGRRDLLTSDGEQLSVFVSTPSGIPAEPTRVEAVPEYLTSGSDGESLELVDVDADGDVDVVVTSSAGAESLGNRELRVLVLVNDGRRLFPDAPDQVLRFEGGDLRAGVADVDGDGAPDLVVRKLELPTVFEVVSDLRFVYSIQLFPGTGEGGRGGRVFSRKPVMKHERTFDESSVQAVVASRFLELDCSGDGIADLIEVDLEGRVAIRRVHRRSSFFGGDTWSLDDAPWKRFGTRGSLSSLEVGDVNGDGLADILSARERGLLVLLSTRGGAR